MKWQNESQVSICLLTPFYFLGCFHYFSVPSLKTMTRTTQISDFQRTVLMVCERTSGFNVEHVWLQWEERCNLCYVHWIWWDIRAKSYMWFHMPYMLHAYLMLIWLWDFAWLHVIHYLALLCGSSVGPRKQSNLSVLILTGFYYEIMRMWRPHHVTSSQQQTYSLIKTPLTISLTLGSPCSLQRAHYEFKFIL